ARKQACRHHRALYLLNVVGTARALSAPRSAAPEQAQGGASGDAFRPLHAGGDAVARRPYLPIALGRETDATRCRAGEVEVPATGRRVPPLGGGFARSRRLDLHAHTRQIRFGIVRTEGIARRQGLGPHPTRREGFFIP